MRLPRKDGKAEKMVQEVTEALEYPTTTAYPYNE